MRFGYVLGAAKQSPDDESNMLQAFADECGSYGEPVTMSSGIPQPVSINTRVVEPDPAIIEEGPTGSPCESCIACQRLVKDEPVKESFGWILPLCTAKGSLVVSPRREAKGCEWSVPGMPRDSTDGIVLRPRYRSGFAFTSEREVNAVISTGNVRLEPTTYPTDLPVEADDAADGIRAWRRVEDPYGDGFVMLPIFDRSFFSEDERTMIPATGDSEHSELYVDYSNLLWKFATDAWEDDEVLCIQSAPGLGKTTFARWLAYLMQVPFRRVMIGPGSDPDDLFGKMLASSGSTYWHDGRFTKAWRAHAGILCVDEPNTGPDEVVVPLRSTTDNSKMLALDASDAKLESAVVVPRGKYTFQVWCMNQSWDVRNIATRDLAMADMSRLTPVVVPYPPEAIERRIVKEACKVLSNYEIPKNLLDDVMKVSKFLREASQLGEYPGSWGIREQIKVARKLRRHPFIEAYRLAALNFFEPSTVQEVIDSYIKVVNSDGL